MKSMNVVSEAFCAVTLGLLVGWYYILLLSWPVLLYLAYRGSSIAVALIIALITLSLIPLSHKPWKAFMNSWIFALWREYFDFSYDVSRTHFNFAEKKYMFLEFPHGIFPMGQFLSASVIDDICPGQMICGTGADVIFYFPVMRHIMAWLGTRRANRKSIRSILSNGHQVAIIPERMNGFVGGIAEMYLVNEKEEAIFLRKRLSTIKVAIEEGVDIVPTFFYGNSSILTAIGGKGSESFLSKLSRRLRLSVMLFHGRWYLPVPYRHPIRLVTGGVVSIEQKSSPTEEEVLEVLGRVVVAVETLYKESRPDWEHRPLVIR